MINFEFGVMDKPYGKQYCNKVTVDIYGHLIPGANKQAVDRLDNLPMENVPVA